jgi:U3 small nucleolar RNA-associated protein 23
MKIKRLKRTRKALLYFQTVHGIRPPFTVLADGTFIQASIAQRISLKDELEKVLGAKVIVAVTDAIVAELRALGEPFAAAAIVARKLQRINLPSGTSRVISDAILHALDGGNPHKLCIATEDERLQARLRKLACVPLIRISRGAVVIERAADATYGPAAGMPLTPPATLATDKPAKPALKRKFTKAANPLSCKPRKVSKPSGREAGRAAGGPSGASGSAIKADALPVAASSKPPRKRQRRRGSAGGGAADTASDA